METQGIEGNCGKFTIGSDSEKTMTKHNALSKEHTLLQFETLAWKQKIEKREAKWNELKWELNVFLDVAPLPTLANEVACHIQVATYKITFLDFKVDMVPPSTSNNSNGSNT